MVQHGMNELALNLGATFVGLNIPGYKVKGQRADFSDRPNFRAELKSLPNLRRRITGVKHFVAIYWRNHVIVDVDWHDDYVPTPEQEKIVQDMMCTYPSYPSMTKRQGVHILVPRECFLNLPQGNPRLMSLCSGENIVEVLTDKATIVRTSLWQQYKPNVIMSPPHAHLNYLDYSPIAEAPKEDNKVEWYEKPMQATDVVEKDAVRDYRRYLSMLSRERCDNRENWLRMAMLGWSLNDFEGWDNWSKRSPKYNRDGSHLRVWNSITSSRIGMGTLIKWAQEDSPALMYPYSQGKLAIEAQGFAFLEENKKLICNGVEITAHDMEMALRPIQYWYEDAKGRGKLRPAFEKWTRDSDRKVYKKRVFRPYNPKLGDPTDDDTYNTAPPFAFTYVDNTPADLFVLEELIRANCMDETVREYIIDWFAAIVQFPEVKAIVAVIFKGHAQGTGKGTIFELFTKILGRSYVHNTNNLEEIFGHFNAALDNALLLGLEELSGREGMRYYDRFKTLVTAEINTINTKGAKPFYQTNLARIVGMSNGQDPLPVDRRTLFAQTNPAKILDRAFWDDLHKVKMKDPEFINRLGSALLDREIKSDLTVVPQVQGDEQRDEKRIRAIHVLLRRIEEEKMSSTIKDGRLVIGVTAFKNEYCDIARKLRKLKNIKDHTGSDVAEMKKWVTEYGEDLIHKKRQRVGGNNNAIYVYNIKLDSVLFSMKKNNLYPDSELMDELFPQIDVNAYD